MLGVQMARPHLRNEGLVESFEAEQRKMKQPRNRLGGSMSVRILRSSDGVSDCVRRVTVAAVTNGTT